MQSNHYSFFIETLGCPKNRADSRQMRSQLLTSGFQESELPSQADFLIVNSCVFVKEAQEETIAETFYKSQERKKNAKLILVGCFVQKYAKEIEKEMTEVDLVVGVGRYHEIAQILSQTYNIVLSQQQTWLHNHQEIFPYAYIRVAKGCSRSCAFCVIPDIRGQHTPFELAQVRRQYQEEKNLKRETPVREIILVSQDTVSQNIDELRRILDFFSAKSDVEWIRLHYLFPEKRVFDMLQLYQEYPKLVSYLDIPFQHVSPAILKKMKRPQDTAIFQEILAAAKQVRADMHIRTSFILGFPDESEEDYQLLEEFISTHTIAYSIEKLSLFRYSHESHTSAFEQFQDNIDDSIKIDRMNRLRELHLQIRKQARQEKIDSIEKLLIDGIEEEVIARRQFDSPEIDEVVFIPKPVEKKLQVGEFINAKLVMPMEYDWIGEYIE